MIKKYLPINPKFPHFMHGGDYNPEQWMDTPEIWDEDIRLMKLSGCNTVSIGIFSWSTLEPEEGKFEFGWLDTIMDKLAENNMFAVLATPSGARPAWMAQKYSEVLRVGANRVRNLFGHRHNHCYTSPVYRKKTKQINTLLAQRYKNHPALAIWHISNEFGGECHCELCQNEFRSWLKQKYENDINKLNYEWWATFWSHRYTDWSQIESPAPHGEGECVHGLTLDWMRFVTHQTTDFIKNEMLPLKQITPEIPVTTNLMGIYMGLDYWKLSEVLDVVSWDNYPAWHKSESELETAKDTAFAHDLTRSLKGKPFMLMESTPSNVNWHSNCKLKRPGMHFLSSMQAVAHGADTVQYFQWRKSRGSSEKFHGAVVDHCGHENTRVFRDVSELGEALKNMDCIIGSETKSEVAIIFDWEIRWALEGIQGLRNDMKEYDYDKDCRRHYESLWKKNISADVLSSDCDLSKYKLVIAPMLYMLKPGVSERLENFVHDGGTLVVTYFSGIANENDLCFFGGFPGPLRKLLGIWAEEIDSIYDYEKVFVNTNELLPIDKQYNVKNYMESVHTETAEVLAVFGNDMFEGKPAVTVNSFGKGKAYYTAFRGEQCFLDDFYGLIINQEDINLMTDIIAPEGVSVQVRTDGENDYIFVMNFNRTKADIKLNGKYTNILTNKVVETEATIDGYGVLVLKK